MSARKKVVKKVPAGTPTDKVIVQKWEESERGWGTRPDGYSLHLNDTAREAYVRSHWARMPKEAPDEYSRPSGEPYQAFVTTEVFDAVKKSKNGTRSFDNNYPGSGGPDGWKNLKTSRASS